MKKFIIAALLATPTTYAFAEDYFTISGKKIALHEQRSSMIAKLGKPATAKNKWISWGAGDVSTTTAEFDQWGVTSLDTSKGSFTINGKTITIGKDTPNTVKSKMGNYCHQFDNGNTNRMSMQSARVGAEGEIYISFYANGTGNTSDKQLLNTPIDSIKLSYEDPLYEPKCNY